jgi:hypothetical protein
MHPEPHYPPPKSFEFEGLPTVTADISQELGLPKMNIAARSHVVRWTPVPEAAVDEHGDPMLLEDNVG